MVETESSKFYPFSAVNDFMREDYRLTILHEVLASLDKIPAEQKMRIGRLISKGIQVQGFRNSNLAPVGMKAKKSVDLFERSPEFAAQVMESWSRLHPELRLLIRNVLVKRNWTVKEDDLDLSQLSGFQIDWPKEDTFQVLIDKARELPPELAVTDDDISLMVVWIGNRLPYDLYEEGN